MPISGPAYQLTFDLDLPEEEAEKSALSVDEIRIREEVARQKLESGESWAPGPEDEKQEPLWWERYVMLRVGHWPFRVAALIAWLGTPRKYRWPATQKELANLLGMSSDRQFTVWRAKNPAIDAMVGEFWKAEAIGRLPDSMQAMFEVAAEPNYKGHRDRELHFKLADLLKDRTEIDLKAGGDADALLKTLPFAKLLELAGINTPEKIAEFKARLEAERQAQLEEGPTPSPSLNSESTNLERGEGEHDLGEEDGEDG